MADPVGGGVPTETAPPVENGASGFGDAEVEEEKFDLPVDENNKAKRLKLWSIARPHMRAFHFAWTSFFLAFFGWFAIAPLQGKIKAHPNNTFLKGSNFKYQNIIAVAGTIIMRLAIGPVCDRFGPRVAQSTILSVFSLPVFLIGTARNFAAWASARFFIGFIGATFVVTQFWTSVMFSSNIVGTANATSAGWGNLGGGVTNAIMPLIRKGISNARGLSNLQDKNDDVSWRIAMVIPACALLIISSALFFFSDDLPDGNYRDLHRAGTKEKTNPFKSMLRASSNWRVWILFLLYAGCFGVELLMNSNLANYFSGNEGKEVFRLNEATAGLVAGLFGIMNLFARSLGGVGSDVMAKRFGLRGRLWWFFAVQLIEGILFVVFSRMRTIGSAVPVLVLFSLCVQAAEGATFGIVPFVDPEFTGAVSGIVGAGGNFGAVAGGFLIQNTARGISTGFRNLGFIVICTAFLIPLLHFPEHGSMFFKGSEKIEVVEEENE